MLNWKNIILWDVVNGGGNRRGVDSLFSLPILVAVLKIV